MSAELANGAPSDSVLVVLARLEGKVDANLAVHGADIKAQGANILDHESRLRIQESRRTVSPAQLWAGLLGVVAVVGAGVTATNGLIDLLAR